MTRGLLKIKLKYYFWAKVKFKTPWRISYFFLKKPEFFINTVSIFLEDFHKWNDAKRGGVRGAFHETFIIVWSFFGFTLCSGRRNPQRIVRNSLKTGSIKDWTLVYMISFTTTILPTHKNQTDNIGLCMW